MSEILYYILIVSTLSAFIFASDKHKARKGRRRIPEKKLHFLEFIGGVFGILPVMYFIRHKNRKSTYYIYTWIAFIFWLFALYYISPV